MLANELDKPTLVGRSAELSGLKTDRLVGDRAFYVTVGGSNRRMLVILDRKLDDGAAEKALQIKPGQTVNVRGRIERLPDSQEVTSRFGVSSEEAEALKQSAIYLHAEQVKITSEPTN